MSLPSLRDILSFSLRAFSIVCLVYDPLSLALRQKIDLLYLQLIFIYGMREEFRFFLYDYKLFWDHCKEGILSLVELARLKMK